MLEKIFKNKKSSTIASISSFVIVFFIILLVKAYIIQLIYNSLGPKLVRNLGEDTYNFEPLTYPESILMMILFTFLFK